MYQIITYNSIIDIDKEAWNSLTENNVYMCYEYLKNFEETTACPTSPYYITVNNGKEIIAASVCYYEEKNLWSSLNNVFLGRLYRYGLLKRINFLPAVICNRQRGCGTHFLFSKQIDKDQIIVILKIIIAEIEAIAKKHKASICFLNVTKDEPELMKNLFMQGYFKTLDLPFNYINISWTSFAGYMEYLSGRYPYMRKSIRHQLNRNRKAGVAIEELKCLTNEERLVELLKMNHFKYNTRPFPLKPNYFQKVKENFGSNSVIYVAKKNKEIIGVSTELRRGTEAFFSIIGVDHEKSQNDLTYFNLAFYEPLKKAAENKIEKVFYGSGLYRTKIKRGCLAEDMFAFYKPAKEHYRILIKLWFAFHRNWMAWKLRDIKKL